MDGAPSNVKIDKSTKEQSKKQSKINAADDSTVQDMYAELDHFRTNLGIEETEYNDLARELATRYKCDGLFGTFNTAVKCHTINGLGPLIDLKKNYNTKATTSKKQIESIKKKADAATTVSGKIDALNKAMNLYKSLLDDAKKGIDAYNTFLDAQVA